MPLKFGTSGLRGLVTEMTPQEITRYTQAFLAACEHGGVLCVGQDLRPSSPRIASDVMTAARSLGLRVIDCGAVPTPALALAALARKGAAVMVTGSHIPADRNGLKFYSRTGEITKVDETEILACLQAVPAVSAAKMNPLETDTKVNSHYAQRYVAAFGATALAGRRVGLYAHSAVGRDVLAEILRGVGAEVVDLGRSETFIPVDTEAVDPETRAQIMTWVAAFKLDALVSTDGDSDRPLLADEKGQVVPGDIMGQITADVLGAEVVVTPISSNSGVTQKGLRGVVLTRIGSPFVIAGMLEARGRVVGYEANGGFLLGFEAQGPAGPLAPLMTRDCTLPLLATLLAGQGSGLAARVAAEPPVVTLSDRLQEIPQSQSGPLIETLARDVAARADFLAQFDQTEAGCDLTDGVRMTLAGGGTLHLRPSGNAPELRVYVEGTDAQAAETLLNDVLAHLRQDLT